MTLRLALLLLVVATIAALTPIGARMAVHEFPPLSMAWFRFGTAGALLTLTCKLTGRRLRFDRGSRFALVVAALLCVPINQIGFLGGIKLANASHAGLFYALKPVLVFWGMLIATKGRFRWAMFVATLLSFGGAAAMVLPGVLSGSTGTTAKAGMVAGDGLLFLAVLSWSAFVVVSQPLVRKFGTLETLTTVFLLGTLAQTPLMLIDVGRLHLTALSGQAWAGFGFVTLVTAYVNYLLWYTVLAKHDITRAAVVVNMHFLLTVVIEHFAFDEPVPPSMLLGCGLTLAGVYLATKPPPKEQLKFALQVPAAEPLKGSSDG